MAYKNPADAAAWRERNKARRSSYMKTRYHANKERLNLQSKQWRENNKDKAKEYNKSYSAANRDHLRQYNREWAAHQQETNEQYRIKNALRQRIYNATKKSRVKKCARTMEIVGCDIRFLMGYLEARFLPGMTWTNQGKKWDIDHHIPCAEFDLRDPRQQKQCFHYSNLRPLWGSVNRSKGAKRPASHQAELI